MPTGPPLPPLARQTIVPELLLNEVSPPLPPATLLLAAPTVPPLPTAQLTVELGVMTKFTAFEYAPPPPPPP